MDRILKLSKFIFITALIVFICPPCATISHAIPVTSFYNWSPWSWIDIASASYEAYRTGQESAPPTNLGQVQTTVGDEADGITTEEGWISDGVSGTLLQTDADTYNVFSQSLNSFLDIIDYVTTLVLGLSIFWSLLSLAIHLLKYGMAPSHPVSRLRTMIEVGSCLCSIALLGSSKVISLLITQMVFQ